MAASAAADPHLELSIVHPRDVVAADPAEPIFLAGEAFLRLDPTDGLDAVLVVDVSASTGLFSGDDLDADRILDRSFAGPDSVLAAEVVAARRVLRELVAAAPRVAIVTFSGAEPGSALHAPPAREPAVLEQTLTTDYRRLGAVLDAVARRPPVGMTDTAAALRRAREALAASPDRRDRVVLLFTDGPPTAPHPGSERNLRAALDEAARCAVLGIRIHTFAIGAEALAHPEAPLLIADATGGYFTPVERAAELADLASRVARASIRRVVVTNRSTGHAAGHVRMDPDGTWSALVGLRAGENVIEVVASALGGVESRRRLVIQGRAGAPPLPVPPDLEGRRRALLEERLAELLDRTEKLKDRLRGELAEEMRREAERRIELEAQRDARP